MNQPKSSTTERGLAAAGIFAGLSGSFAVWFFDPSRAVFFPLCPLHALTGLSCPGCGLTRGFHALFHGDIAAALQLNLLLPVYALAFAYLFIHLVLLVMRSRGLSYRFLTPLTVYGFFIMSLVFAILRNLPWYPFTMFAV